MSETDSAGTHHVAVGGGGGVMSARLPKEGRGRDVLRCDVRGEGIEKERKTTKNFSIHLFKR